MQSFFTHCEDMAKDIKTSVYLAWTTGKRDSMHKVCISHRIPRTGKRDYMHKVCISHRIPHAWGQQE